MCGKARGGSERKRREMTGSGRREYRKGKRKRRKRKGKRRKRKEGGKEKGKRRDEMKEREGEKKRQKGERMGGTEGEKKEGMYKNEPVVCSVSNFRFIGIHCSHYLFDSRRRISSLDQLTRVTKLSTLGAPVPTPLHRSGLNFEVFSPRRGDTLHRWGRNLAWRRDLPSFLPNFAPIGATIRIQDPQN